MEIRLDQTRTVAYKRAYARRLCVCASKMEAQPVLVLAARDGASGEGSAAFIIEHGGDRFAVIITGMGTRNAEAKADAALVSCPAEFPTLVVSAKPPHRARGVYPQPLRSAQGRSQRKGERARHPLPQKGRGV